MLCNAFLDLTFMLGLVGVVVVYYFHSDQTFRLPPISKSKLELLSGPIVTPIDIYIAKHGK